MGLKYTGGGYGGFAANVPARDLTDEEVKQHGGEETLIATGLYEREHGRGWEKVSNKPDSKGKDDD